MQIRMCSAGDCARLAEMNKRLIDDEKSDNPMSVGELEDRMKGFLNNDHSAYFFLEDGQVIGYALVRNSADPVYLRQFFIDRDHRKQRCGTRAFQLLVEHLGVKKLELEVLPWNEAGRSFRKSCGFKEISITMRYEEKK